MRIAIIGAGISGLTAAYRLSGRHQVTLFEAGPRAGGHADTQLIDDPAAGTIAVDTGFIVFNRRNYPGFCAILDELGVESSASDMSFSVRNDRSHIEYGTGTLRELFSDPVSLIRPRFYRMLRDLFRFNREAVALLEADPALTVGNWLEAAGYSPAFVEDHLLPLIGALWSAEPDAAARFPVRHLAQFLDNHGMLGINGRPQWRTIAGGSQRYVEAITASLPAPVRTDTPVRGVRRKGGFIELDLDTGTERYDEVVFACHSDQALRLLRDPSEPEREVLGAIAYRDNEVILHNDVSVLPRHLSAWSSWNALVPADAGAGCRVSYWMNRLQGLPTKTPWIVSLNQREAIDPGTIHSARNYAHPVFNAAALRAQARFDEVSGVRGTHYCGAWWGWGFHEDGVQSALRVAGRIAAGGERAAAA